MQVGDLGKVDPRVMTPADALSVHAVHRQRAADGSQQDGSGPVRPVLKQLRALRHRRPGRCEKYFAGPAHGLQECTFVPRGLGQRGRWLPGGRGVQLCGACAPSW